MNSPTTSTATPVSTSPPAATPSKLAVVPRPQPLTATKVSATTAASLEDGRALTAHAGDWLIARGKRIVDVVGDSVLRERYQVIEAGALTLNAETCVRLESTLGIGATLSTERLTQAVERLASISIGTVKVEFTPGQLAEIALRAQKRGQTIEQALAETVSRIKEELFWKQ